MRVIVSNHAYDRMIERTNINKYKFDKVAEKAWSSNGKNYKKLKSKIYLKKWTDKRNSIIKGYNGQIYIFQVKQAFDGEVVAVLITMY